MAQSPSVKQALQQLSTSLQPVLSPQKGSELVTTQPTTPTPPTPSSASQTAQPVQR